MYKILCPLFISLMALTTNAQTNNDPVYLNYHYFPVQSMDEIKEEASLQMVEASLILPKFHLSTKTEVYTQFNYKFSVYGYDENLNNAFPNHLNDIRLGWVIRHQFSEQWGLIASPRINLRTDFSEKLVKYDFFPSMNLIGLRTSPKNKNLSYGIGISYNNDLDKNAITPLGYLKYQHPKFRIYSILPSFAYFLFTPSEKFEYGLSYNLDSGIFHIDNLNSDTKNYLKTSNLTIAPTIGYNFYNQFWFNAKAGYVMFRRYHLLDADFEELPGMEKNKIDDGFFTMFGVSLRMNEK